MGNAFTKLPQDKLNTAVAGLLCPRINKILGDRGLGHCMRVTDLEDDIMETVCKELCRIRPDGKIFILGSHDQEGMPFRVTSTKLVELRNPDANGELRKPLLVFIPTSLRTSAEDSFSVATFEELTFTAIYEDLVNWLLDQLPVTLVNYTRDLFRILSEEGWFFADDLSRARYLLTALENGIDGETLGASLYELTLIPDFKLFADPGTINGKIRRNLDNVRNLMTSHKSMRGRIADLGLSDKALESQLFTYFEQYDVQEPETWTPTIATDKSWWSISFDKWAFQEELSLDKILLTVLETDLPVIEEGETDDQLFSLIGQQVLVPNDRRKMAVEFKVNLHPRKIRGLDHFTVQIVSQNGGPVGKSKRLSPGHRIVCNARPTLPNSTRSNSRKDGISSGFFLGLPMATRSRWKRILVLSLTSFLMKANYFMSFSVAALMKSLHSEQSRLNRVWSTPDSGCSLQLWEMNAIPMR